MAAVVVSGAAGGIGRAVCQAFVASGAMEKAETTANIFIVVRSAVFIDRLPLLRCLLWFGRC